ncbi:MAG: hypothetical protein ABR509_01160 [Candidatus Limnocylindria bacterium]
MDSSNTGVTFRLTAASLDVTVDVRLRSFGDRWVAVADVSGRHEVGLGANPRQALRGALASLGDVVTRHLLADPALFGASTALGRAARSAPDRAG